MTRIKFRFGKNGKAGSFIIDLYLGSNYTQCGLLHATKSNCGHHHCIGYMGTNTSVLHGYCKPREYQFLNIEFD